MDAWRKDSVDLCLSTNTVNESFPTLIASRKNRKDSLIDPKMDFSNLIFIEAI